MCGHGGRRMGARRRRRRSDYADGVVISWLDCKICMYIWVWKTGVRRWSMILRALGSLKEDPHSEQLDTSNCFASILNCEGVILCAGPRTCFGFAYS
jgi:hypothetical protein